MTRTPKATLHARRQAPWRSCVRYESLPVDDGVCEEDKKTPAAPAYGCGRQETPRVGLQSQTAQLERDGHGTRTVDCGLPSLQVIRHGLPGVKRFREAPPGSVLPGGQRKVAANCDTSVPSSRQSWVVQLAEGEGPSLDAFRASHNY